MHRSKNRFRLADRPADYKRLDISPVEIAEFEDGQRIGAERGRYEWWYFDAHLDNGATIVVVYYTKPNVSPNGPLAPRIAINITLPDGGRRARKTLCLASLGAPRTGKRPLHDRPRGTPRLRQRISRSQLERRPHADAHAQLMLGAGQRRALYGHRILHHSHRSRWV
jgi:hypothetical protein